jgi:hypothetical protein
MIVGLESYSYLLFTLCHSSPLKIAGAFVASGLIYHGKLRPSSPQPRRC